MIITNLPYDLRNTLQNLEKLSDDTSALYALVKKRLRTCKEFKVSLIGNPIFHLETEVIQLHYLILQHIDVCKNFQDLKINHMDLTERQKQIDELLFVYKELKSCYRALRSKSFMIPLRFTTSEHSSVRVS